MVRQRLRLFEIRKNESFDDQKSASEIANSEVVSADSAEFQEYVLSQLKRIIHGDDSGNWHDDIVNVFGANASLKALLNTSEKPLAIDFDWTDVVGGSLSLGTVLADTVIRLTVIQITNPFDGNTGISVGDTTAQGRFQTIADNNPAQADFYQAFNHYAYPSDTEVKLFFPTGTPTAGAGKAILYVDR